MSAEHPIRPLDGVGSGELFRSLRHGIREFGSATVGITGVIVTGIPEAIRSITTRNSNQVTDQSPTQPFLMYRD